VPHGSNIDQIRVTWVDADPPDLTRLFEANMLPGIASVQRSVDSDSRRDVPARLTRPGADVYDVRIRVGYCDSSNGADLEEFVG